MPYQLYTVLHIVSLMVVVITLGAILGHFLQGGTKAGLKTRKLLMRLHGAALLFAFVAGFAMMAKGGFNFGTSQWLYVKILCWLLLGAFPVLLFKKVMPPWVSLIVLTAVIALAVFVVEFKPF